jgi:hypothetical protein
MPTIPFDEYEQELVRFFAQRYLEHKEQIDHEQFPRYEELGKERILQVRKRLRDAGLITGVHVTRIEILPAILHAAEQLDNPPLPDYRDKLTKWFWSKPWSIVIYVLIVGLPALLGWVIMLKTLLEWFGIAWQR